MQAALYQRVCSTRVSCSRTRSQAAALAVKPCSAAVLRGSSHGSTRTTPEHFTSHGSLVVARSQSDAASQFDVDDGKAEQLGVELGPREDDILPDSLADAIQDAAKATAEAINSGVTRCQVEILLPEFWDPISGPIFPNRGDQERFWRMTRRFVEYLGQMTRSSNVKAVYPDAGVAAMLAHQWEDKAFAVDSLNARRPVSADDDLIVICCPDPPGAEECQRTVRQVGEQDEKAGALDRPVVLFNQRLSSGDVGIGLNARRLRENFLKRFNITYSLRPVGEVGTVFRKYPEQWKVFIEEPELPGRYRLIATKPFRPAGEALDNIIMQALDPAAAAEAAEGGQPSSRSLLDSIGATMASMQRFMRSLSN